MTPEQFKAWRKHMKISQASAAGLLGISVPSIQLYEKGSRHEDGRAVVIPKAIELACAALALGIREYEGPQVG
ncbi:MULTISPECIES: helix-turn-helix transcriptional regulator [unclassified Chelatococcus]|uniref:helix-turn-helix domain-containing protein n=1 Tax=unclassified Chelatococcus TaxID=2638111 RepID=UPI001BCFEF4F|nr:MULTISPECIES: helix-turn-helix transcriptional regulator [unclassified Chelatococcus]CAH1670861.1 Helix-turn-helix transcriptional regulator [Hyphomicrobiales bacterium]MBS7738390.1 helix-turn-helix transcriptional regulator [Chelatococcus sp. HY11]MBX3542794.1 helix-turn-helix transcriptional regulator [Chelatococcus sp.]MCO5077080.1 helix-turn-helix domain-containing protein [Chelatococcus sp.]CAH1676917.1 Helix-turn-helix transcriptional regulator [Hyphomicrobiales bacterium]